MARGIFFVQNRISCTTNKASESIQTIERTRGTLFSRVEIRADLATVIVSAVTMLSTREGAPRTVLLDACERLLRAFGAGPDGLVSPSWERAVQANQTQGAGVPDDQSALIEALRDQIEDLRRERDEWREQARITDRLLSAAMERIPPQLGAPSEVTEAAETAEQQQGSGDHPTRVRQKPGRAYSGRGGAGCSGDKDPWPVGA
jgi:hypothetical protein